MLIVEDIGNNVETCLSIGIYILDISIQSIFLIIDFPLSDIDSELDRIETSLKDMDSKERNRKIPFVYLVRNNTINSSFNNTSAFVLII
ncbi:hypothetical protein HZS_1323 [Henneguya salminicola]|nr:hypothetical protein HZS_1323 [Henneguya salminicola]